MDDYEDDNKKVCKILKQIIASLHRTENIIKRDMAMLERDKQKMKKLEKRTEKLEVKNKIELPPELVLAGM